MSVEQLWPVVTAFLGGSAATILNRLIEWRRKPAFELSLDFTALQRAFPIEDPDSRIMIGRAKYFRLKVRNVRPVPAHHCEAKIEPMDLEGKSLFDPSILHWVRRDEHVYRQTEDQFAPIAINSKDYEFLDVLKLVDVPVPPSQGEEDRGYRYAYVQTYSHRPFVLWRVSKSGYDYRLKVTVFGENAEPKSITIAFLGWDGTFDGFNEKCFSLVE